jgi:hypothetical protein
MRRHNAPYDASQAAEHDTQRQSTQCIAPGLQDRALLTVNAAAFVRVRDEHNGSAVITADVDHLMRVRDQDHDSVSQHQHKADQRKIPFMDLSKSLHGLTPPLQNHGTQPILKLYCSTIPGKMQGVRYFWVKTFGMHIQFS